MTDHTHADDPLVAAVLTAAAAPAEHPLPGEAEALAVFRSVLHPSRRTLMSRLSENAKLVAAAIFGGAVVISGAAAAATGSLPLVGSSHAHPHPANTHSPDATDDQGGDVGGTSTDTPAGPNGDHGKGASVSQLAHQLKDSGATHRGQTICILASGGHCHANQQNAGTHGNSALPHGKAGQSHGQSDATTHGQATVPHGQSDATTHGQATVPHGQSNATTHGQATVPHGNAHSSS